MMLSRLSFLKRKHTWAVDQSDVEDLFVQLNHAGINRHLRISVVSEDIKAVIRQRVTQYVNDERLRLRYRPWQNGSSTTQRHWDVHPQLPPKPYAEPDAELYKSVLTNVLRSFLR